MPHLGLDSYAATLLWLLEIGGFLVSVFWRAEIGLYILIPLLPLQTVRYRVHGMFLGDQFVDVLLLGVILGLKRQGRPVFSKTPLNVLLWTYIIFTYLSMFRGSFFLNVDMPLWFSDPRVSDWKNYVVDLTLMYFVTVSAIRTKRQMGILIITMSIGCLLVAKGFHNVIGDRDFSTFSYELRDSGPLGWAGVNGLAAFAAQASVFLTALYLAERRFLAKMAYFGVVASGVYCLVFALSRGGYAAFLIGILYLGIVRSRLLLAGLILFLLGWEGLVPAAVQERITMTTDSTGELDHSAEARISLWQEAMHVFDADPVFGTGFNTYSYGDHVGGYRDTHNVYVKVLVETGLSGLLLFLAIFQKLFQIGFRLNRLATDPFLKSIGLGFSALMLAVFIGNLFGDRWMYFQITGYTYAFGALATRALQMTEEPELEEVALPTAGADLVEAAV